MRCYDFFLSSRSKSEKSYRKVWVILNKIYLSLLTTSLRPLFLLIYFLHFTILGSCYRKKLASVFYAYVLVLMINFVIALPKFIAKPHACGSWFHSQFDNGMTQFVINKRKYAWKSDVDLLIWRHQSDLLTNHAPRTFPFEIGREKPGKEIDLLTW